MFPVKITYLLKLSKFIEIIQTFHARCAFYILVCPAQVAVVGPESIIEGTSVILTCNSSSSNPPVKFQWLQHGYNIVNSTYEYIYEDAEYNGKITSQRFATDNTISRYGSLYYKCCIRPHGLSCDCGRYRIFNIYCKLNTDL